MKINSSIMEVAIAHTFGIRQHIIVPNISWGLMSHEADMLIITKAGYATEVEIKISKSDLIADFKKPKHKRNSMLIKEFYYAIPEDLYDKCKELIPEKAGLIVVGKYEYGWYASIKRHPEPKRKIDYRKLTDKEILNVARLGTMRIFNLKNSINNLSEELKQLKKLNPIQK